MDLPAPIKRLADALNAHDPMQVAAAFTVDYHREVPTASRTSRRRILAFTREQNNGKTAVGQQMHNSFSACSVPSLRIRSQGPQSPGWCEL